MSDSGLCQVSADLPTLLSLVLSTLQPLLKSAPSRACYRLIGGTLVQRTVIDVYPALETNYSGIKEVLDTLAKTYRGKEEEFVGFQKEYGIQVGLIRTHVRGLANLISDAWTDIALIRHLNGGSEMIPGMMDDHAPDTLRSALSF